MRKLLFIFILLFSFFEGFTQHKITGVVTDQDLNPLDFASVFLEGTDYMAVTDEKGQFVIENVPTDEYLIKVTFLGFKDYEEIFFLDGEKKFIIELEGQAFGLDQIQINGTWAKEKFPFAFTGMNKEQLTNQNRLEDVPYVLQYTPSVVVSSDAGTGVGYTGIRVRGVDPTRVNVNINGIPYNDPESQSVYWVNIPDIMASTNDIQVQRGIGTSMHGTGSFGASINLNTKKVNLDPHLSVNSSFGSFNTYKLSAEGGVGLINDKFTLDGRYSLIRTDGYVDRAKASLTSYFFTGSKLSNKETFRINVFGGQEITYQAWYGLPIQYHLKDTLRTFNSAGTDNDFSITDPYDNEVDNYKQNHIQLFWEKALKNKINLNLAGFYTRGIGFYEQFKANQKLADYGLNWQSTDRADLIRRKWLDNYFFGINYDISQTNLNSQWVFGGSVNDYYGKHFGQVDSVYNDLGIKVAGDYLYYDNFANKLGADTYFKYLRKLGKFTTFGDIQYRLIRYELNGLTDKDLLLDDVYWHHFINPKLGVNYDFNAKSRLYTSVAFTSNEPGRKDYTENELENIPDPEKMLNVEAGYTFHISQFRTALGLYFMRYFDQLILTGKLNDVGDYSRINVPDSYRAGMELELAYSFSKYVDTGFGLTLSRNKIRRFVEYIDDWDLGGQIEVIHDDTDISFSPGVIAGGEIRWHLINRYDEMQKGQRLSLAVSGKYVGKQYLDNTMNDQASLDPYFFADLNLSYHFSKAWLANSILDVQVNNLFNSKYVSNGWVYRYKSEAYDPVPYDPYTVNDKAAYYNMIGVFPQALRSFTMRLRLSF